MSWPACPKCGGETSCVDSRPLRAEVRRRYRCKDDKKHRWTTIEKIAERELLTDELVTAHGKTRSISAWAKKLGVRPNTLLYRMGIMKLSPNEAMNKSIWRRQYVKVKP